MPWRRLLLLLAVGCGQPPATESTTNPIVGGTPREDRSAIGRLLGPGGVRCTGTLIHPRFVLTAAHCLGFSESNPGNYQFAINASGGEVLRQVSMISIIGYSRSNVTLTPAQSQNITLFITPDNKGNHDVAVLLLSSAVAAGDATPIALSRNLPAAGERVTVWGYGCSAQGGSDFGTKRFFSFSYADQVGQRPPVTCEGDSGGPAVFGEADQGGRVWGVVSSGGTADAYGNVPWFYDTILRSMMRMMNVSSDSPFLSGINLEGLVDRQLSANGRACEEQCILDGAACEGWAVVGTQCTLFTAVRGWVPQTSAGAMARQYLEKNFDRPGGDLQDPIPLGNGGPEVCRAECARRSNCQSFTWVPRGQQSASDAFCWVKGSVPSAGGFAGLQSGTRRGLHTGVFVDGRLGGTLTRSDPGSCADECARDPKCRAFSWVPPSACTKRIEAGAISFQSGAVSGIKDGLEYGIDRPGADLPNQPIVLGSPFTFPPGAERCQMECENNAQCVAFTYVPRIQGTTEALCWLKGGIPLPITSRKGLVSGVKGGAFF